MIRGPKKVENNSLRGAMVEQSRLKLIGLVGFPGNAEDLKNRTAGLACVYTRALVNGCKIKA